MTQAHPLQWPQGWARTPADRRERTTKFREATFSVSIQKLEHELRLMHATDCVFSSNLRLGLSGKPLSEQAMCIADPGVAVYFTLRGKQMSMARDVYDNVKDNLRSLGLAVEYLRGLERHGGASMLERAFAGFTALPPPETANNEPAVDWRQEFGPVPGGMENFEILALIEARYRDKAKRAHSDLGGKDTLMIRLNLAIAQAREELR